MSGPRPIPIPSGIRPQLGTMPDRCVAAQTGISLSTIARWRYALRIPAYTLHATTQRYLRLLAAHPGGLSAREIAAALGISRQGAHAALVKLAQRGVVRREQFPKITPYMRPPVRWHAAKKEPRNAEPLKSSL